MSIVNDEKKLYRHLNCAVCGVGFNAQYEESLRSYPIYHSRNEGKKTFQCEAIFYESLIRTYAYLHKIEASVPIQELVRIPVLQENISMRKEMLSWCLSRGYLGLDKLKRIVIPPPVENICNEIFTSYQLSNASSLMQAIEYIKTAFHCHMKELEAVAAEIPVEDMGEPEHGNTFDLPSIITESDNTPRMAITTFKGPPTRGRK